MCQAVSLSHQRHAQLCFSSPPTSARITPACMPHPTSQARAARALRRAISLTPSSHPLRQSLRVLSNPLAHHSSHTHLDESTWQATLNQITTFADHVIQSLNNPLDNDALSSLHNDAVQMHRTLDQKGFHTAFHPSHVCARALSAFLTCADSSEQTEGNMRVVSSSLPATYQCLEQIFNSPVTAVDPTGILCNIADQHRYNTPPPASTAVPPVDTVQFESLQSSYDVFISKLNHVPIPELGRKRVRTFVDLLWQQNLISDKKVNVEGTPSRLPLCDHLGSTPHSLVVSAVLDVSEDPSADSRMLWTTMVALKTLRLSSNAEKKRLVLQQETLRLKVLSHPCIPVFYGAVWPRSDGQATAEQNVHLIAERMTQSVRAGRHTPALRPFEVRIRILHDVANALRHLHAQQGFHGSLSPENVLIRVYDDMIYGRAKVDVTCLAERALIGEVRKHPMVYEPPESFYTEQRFFTSDVWSFGVLACFLLTDKCDAENDKSFVRSAVMRGKEGSVAQEWAKQIGNDRARDLVIRCLHLRPERRPNAEDVYVDISEILTQKSVKADVVTPAATAGASPVRDHTRGSLRDCRELSGDSQGNHRAMSCSSFAESDHVDSSLKIGNIPKTARKTAPAPRQEGGAGDSLFGMNRVSSPKPPRPCEVSGDADDKEYNNLRLSLSDETGLDDVFKFQVDWTGKTRCVKRKTSCGVRPGPSKRTKIDHVQEKVRETSEITAGLRQATMEEIFGPFSSSSSLGGLDNPAVKAESVLENDPLPTADVPDRNTSRVKVEETVSHVGETAKIKDASNHEQNERRNEFRTVGRRVEAKAEPLLEGVERIAIPTSTTTPAASASARKPPKIVKHERRRQRVSRRGKRRSRSDRADGNNKDYKPTQSMETQPSTSWKGRMRKRTPGSLKYADRSPSAAPSSSSHGADSNAPYPSDSIFDIESSNGVLRSPKGHKGNNVTEKRSLDSQEGFEPGRDGAKKKNDRAKASGSTAPEKQMNGQEDMTLEFLKRAKEGESPLDFYRRESQNGNVSAFVRIGVLYEEGRHVKCDYGMAFSSYQRAAAAGNSEGQLRLARCYEDGRGVSKNEPAAAALFIQAADADNVHAQYRAGMCFEEGRGVVRDLRKALHYLNKCVEQRDPEACHRVAGLCKEGKWLRKDEARAFELYKVASDAGHVPSMVQLANMFAKGLGGAKRSITKAVVLYRRASDAGNPHAKLALGLLHEDGQGVKKSSESALKLYREAADAGYAPAMTALGQCFLWGYGVKQDLQTAVDLFRNAAKQGDSLAQHELGNCYKEGSGLEQDYDKALYFYKKASAQGCSVALVQYGEFLYSGHGIPQHYEKAFEQFQRAADLGAAEGYRWLGECYADGTGVQQDPKKAFQMYQKGADMGSSSAQTCLGVCYENGNGVERSKTKALQWYRKASAEGNHTAMNNLGIFYEQGRLVKRDPKRAVSYYQKAIDLGSVDAICNLADCYASGNGIARDMKMAVQHYQDAADHGMSGAKCELGVCYYYGKGVRQDFEKAMDLFKEASDSEPEALRHLGTGFYDGNGVEKDYNAAVRLYKKAISRGNIDANFDLAVCYSSGMGVARDDRVAASLLEIAADHGNRYAKLTLGNRYYEGRGVKQDIQRAVTLFREAGEIDLTQPLTDDRVVGDEPQLAETKSQCV